MWSCEPRGRQRTYPVAYAPIAWVISLFPAKAPEKRIVPYVWPLYAGLPKSRMTTPVAPRFAAPQPCFRKTLRAVVFSYSEMVAREGTVGFGWLPSLYRGSPPGRRPSEASSRLG